jgi:cullin 1
VSQYLNAETESKIVDTVTRELLAKTEEKLLNKEGSGCRALLINDMKDDLSRMFRMFSRIHDGLTPMALIFNHYIVECGNEKIKERKNRLAALGDGKKESADDSEFVQALLKMHSRFYGLIQECFDDSASFHKSLKEAFQEIVNTASGKHGTCSVILLFFLLFLVCDLSLSLCLSLDL